MPSEPELSPEDPLGLDRVEREIRLEKLRRDIEEVTGEEFVANKTEHCDPELEEAFLEHVLALESMGLHLPSKSCSAKVSTCPRLRNWMM